MNEKKRRKVLRSKLKNTVKQYKRGGGRKELTS